MMRPLKAQVAPCHVSFVSNLSNLSQWPQTIRKPGNAVYGLPIAIFKANTAASSGLSDVDGRQIGASSIGASSTIFADALAPQKILHVLWL